MKTFVHRSEWREKGCIHPGTEQQFYSRKFVLTWRIICILGENGFDLSNDPAIKRNAKSTSEGAIWNNLKNILNDLLIYVSSLIDANFIYM